ncbi:MAG TPA: hypothetical protein VH020_10760 [Stellaceae bacterium]|jgi:RsiW-degrading membrane proteinase PrsW (M82 family)|nr:hypothetical protein [Stellaceae bacterium]
MAFRPKRSAGGGDKIAISPVLLAAVLALLWVAFFPGDGGDIGAPDWGMPIVVGTRFIAGFVAGWVVISLAHVALRLLWLGASQFYVRSRRQ